MDKLQGDVRFDAGVVKPQHDCNGAKLRGRWRVACYRVPEGAAIPDGELPQEWMQWQDEYENMVVDEGCNYVLSASLAGGTPITTWYLGIMNASPTVAATDTMASHAGWTEWTNYSEATRQQWVAG